MNINQRPLIGLYEILYPNTLFRTQDCDPGHNRVFRTEYTEYGVDYCEFPANLVNVDHYC